MAEQHGALQSAVTGRAKVFRGFKLAGHVLGSLPCIMTAKTENGSCFTVAAAEAHIPNSILPTYGTFPRGRSHMRVRLTLLYLPLTTLFAHVDCYLVFKRIKERTALAIVHLRPFTNTSVLDLISSTRYP